jgi:hypothetical protein
VLLKSLEDLSHYRAASANLQVVVDVEQDDKLLPSFIRGERTRAVTITLPAATLTVARLDPSRSRVSDRDRGLTNRVEDVFSDNPGDEAAALRGWRRGRSRTRRTPTRSCASGRRRTPSTCSRG